MEGTHRRSASRGPSWRLLALIALLTVLVMACIVGLFTMVNALDPQARAAREAARWREEQQAQQLSGLDLVVAGGWRLLPLMLVSAGAFVALGIAWRRWGQQAAVYSDKQVAMARALTQRYPAGLQSLNTSYHNAARLTGPDREMSTNVETLALPDAVPTFSDLLTRGSIGPGNPLLLGYADGQPLAGDWRDLYSSAVAGVSGSGKTTTLRFLACQSSLHGARWVLLDPHAEAGDDSLAGTLAPLARAFLCQPASNPRAMMESVKLVAGELDKRLTNSAAPRWPLILAADEFTSLMRGDLAEPLAALIERIAQEGRKVLVFALVSGQVWTAERTGGSALRDSLASAYVHRMKRRQANHLLQLGDELPETLNLPTGAALLYRTTGELVQVAIPNTTGADVVRVAGLLTGDAPTMQATPRLIGMPKSSQNVAWNMPDDMPTGSQRVAYDNLATNASGRATTASAEAMRAAALFLAGSDPAAIVWELRGVRSNQGKKYQEALGEVLRLMREGLGGC